MIMTQTNCPAQNKLKHEQNLTKNRFTQIIAETNRAKLDFRTEDGFADPEAEII